MRLDIRPARSSALVVALLAAGAAGAQDPVGQHGDWWNLGILSSGMVYKTTLDVRNENCAGAHDFQVRLDTQFTKSYLVLQRDPIVRAVPPGSSKTLQVAVDLRGAPAGGYERGGVLIECLTCPAVCGQNYRRLRVTFAIIEPIDEPFEGPPGSKPKEPPIDLGGGGPKPTPPPGGSSGGGGGEQPTPPVPPPGSRPAERREDPTPRCGPDISSAFDGMLVDLLSRIDFLPESERGDGAPAFLQRNPTRPFKVNPIDRCPSQPQCLYTVQLHGRCIEEGTIEDIVEGILVGRLGATSDRLKPLEEGSQDPLELRSAAGFAIGRGIGSGLGAPLDVRDQRTADEIRSEGRMWFQSEILKRVYGPAGEPWSQFAACTPCPEATGFSEDWTTRDWYLAGGKVAKP